MHITTHTQAQSAAKSSLSKRLEALRVSKQLTWDGLAGFLEISPSMIYQVRRGDRRLGDLALHRLEEAEIDEGLLTLQDASFDRLWRMPRMAESAETAPLNASRDAHIRMRLECLADIIDTYDSDQMQALLKRVDDLINSEKKFGKVFVQLGEVIAHVRIRKQQREDVVTPKAGRKQKPK